MGVLLLWKRHNPAKVVLGTEMGTMAVIVIVAVIVDLEEVLGDLTVVVVAVVVVTASNVVSLDILLVNVHLMTEAGMVAGMVTEGIVEVVAGAMDLIVGETVTVEEVVVEAAVVGTETLVVVEGLEVKDMAVTVTALAHMSALHLVVTARLLMESKVRRMLLMLHTRGSSSRTEAFYRDVPSGSCVKWFETWNSYLELDYVLFLQQESNLSRCGSIFCFRWSLMLWSMLA